MPAGQLCTCDARAACTRRAHAVQAQCKRSASAMQAQCKRRASAVQAPWQVVAIDHLGLGLSGARYSFPADLWGCGVLLFESLCAGRLPFPAERDASAQPTAIVFGPAPLDAISDGGARRLLQRLLAERPAESAVMAVATARCPGLLGLAI